MSAQDRTDDYTILNTALSGRKLSDILVVDCHGHLDLWKAAPAVMKTGIDGIIENMDRIGIDVVCINKWNYPDMKAANNDVARAIRRYPDRVAGFAATMPSLGRETMHDELKRCFDELGFKGIKVHNGYETLPLRDQTNLPEYADALECIWEFAAQKECAVLCHGFLTPEIARRYPEAIFLSAHAGGVREQSWNCLECKNVYFDTANSLVMRSNIEYLVDVVGAERVLYGSDLPYADPAYRIGQVIGTRLNDEQLRKILGENMALILGLKQSRV